MAPAGRSLERRTAVGGAPRAREGCLPAPGPPSRSAIGMTPLPEWPSTVAAAGGLGELRARRDYPGYNRFPACGAEPMRTPGNHSPLGLPAHRLHIHAELREEWSP